jgi:hypothetical protein
LATNSAVASPALTAKGETETPASNRDAPRRTHRASSGVLPLGSQEMHPETRASSRVGTAAQSQVPGPSQSRKPSAAPSGRG